MLRNLSIITFAICAVVVAAAAQTQSPTVVGTWRVMDPYANLQNENLYTFQADGRACYFPRSGPDAPASDVVHGAYTISAPNAPLSTFRLRATFANHSLDENGAWVTPNGSTLTIRRQVYVRMRSTYACAGMPGNLPPYSAARGPEYQRSTNLLAIDPQR